ncbi:unnamed protein product [Orchesella dallaii]|uniref:Uncharacterized protein n=1 Tax=Orchesella dallaii TaxID=48710 RepID=A0ABP1Q4D0_9HEXA
MYAHLLLPLRFTNKKHALYEGNKSCLIRFFSETEVFLFRKNINFFNIISIQLNTIDGPFSQRQNPLQKEEVATRSQVRRIRGVDELCESSRLQGSLHFPGRVTGCVVVEEKKTSETSSSAVFDVGAQNGQNFNKVVGIDGPSSRHIVIAENTFRIPENRRHYLPSRLPKLDGGPLLLRTQLF